MTPDFEPLAGRDPAGREASWLITALDSGRVKTHDGSTLVLRSLPPEGSPADLAVAEMLLDNEIRALTRLHTRYLEPLRELPRIVGYDFDSADPFLLLEPPIGKCVDGGLRTLLIDERRRFMIGLFRALAQLDAVGLVHGSVGLSSLCWDGATTQLVNLHHAVGTGEVARSGLSRNGSVAHPGHDVRAAGRVVYELFTGKHVALGDTPDLASQPEVLASLLRGVFDQDPRQRPTASQMLERLNDRDPLPRPVDVTSAMKRGYDRFDELRPPKPAEKPVLQPTAPRPPRATPMPKQVSLVPLAIVVFLVVAAIATLVAVIAG
ncbi:hypothetical protein FXN61_47135 [Lentzea sp. PSKA42]|uniref:Protein kinase domain-containing protein n=1 Tax=Lentzea indica TaxID=2604800 RepID=A0ABX1FZE6_9PSEU|nr:hypothetical protein [Lentzea indica]NKE63877.1 hypothetical protein [Lentzea indica]